MALSLARNPIHRSLSSFRSRAFKCSMAASSIRVGAVQMTSTNDIEANFNTCSRLVKEASIAGVKLLCFPEAFSFVSSRDGESLEIAEPIDGPIMQRYCSLARESNIWLSLGGFQEKGPDDNHLHNTHVLVDDTGSIKSLYRKIHLFDVDVPGNMVYKESNFTTPGDDIVVEDSPVGRLGLTVCYDIRFPELYQLLRFQHNAQVVAAAQAGKHNEKRESYGDSLIIDPWGRIIARLPDRLSTGIAIADIDFSNIDSVRTRMPIANHQKLGTWRKAPCL
ncbi:deaminated glutathione amidase, chloroplastic/cytosolic-like isoform X5 [Dioscorea cayenensis subsp. rotundata]|uniref:Deaminated glutathione amidase, chloroplastic/cytosolic-like isoform X5 n=1 Tax=Dioscorea cayennensis subsp. rotundata TaxID=55577 RepID=A0AB40CCW2_DIOCR|nr:deaminated glutathione amidase, chloroplastic/cytosolic-like isoform X5 [Dioscorea cayenensis subsp. rotundata]